MTKCFRVSPHGLPKTVRVIKDMLIKHVLLSVMCGMSAFAAATAATPPRGKEAMESATQLQVFLDRSRFSPGKLDGRFGEFTRKALALYRQSRGETPQPLPETKTEEPPDMNGLDFSIASPVFINYTVTEADLAAVGEMAASMEKQAKQKSLPYKDALEAIGEKFHSDPDFIAELNPGKVQSIKAGDTLTVPNVEPFDLAAVKDLTPGNEAPGVAANDVEDTPAPNERPPADTVAEIISVNVDVKSGMLQVLEKDKLVAAYPVTVGSGQTASPIGEWKVKGVAKMPNFRYDKAML
ncbi:MAG: murein L,D-transpeptidase, partial [Verrucomicrobiaceae bacterium]|nr:murein L,D-transpeptidase [Verrucomicrobiaceae bacterium]